MKVQVIASRPKGQWFPIVSWLIRLAEWSKQSHVIFYFPELNIARHAHFNDIKEESIESFLKTNKIVTIRNLDITNEQFLALDSWTSSKVGKQHGYFSTLLGCLIPQIAYNLFKIRLSNPFYKGLTCSEFIREGLRKVNEVAVFVLTNDILPGTFTTDDSIQLASDLLNFK